jgi:hypothetical protein
MVLKNIESSGRTAISDFSITDLLENPSGNNQVK